MGAVLGGFRNWPDWPEVEEGYTSEDHREEIKYHRYMVGFCWEMAESYRQFSKEKEVKRWTEDMRVHEHECDRHLRLAEEKEELEKAKE